MAESERFVLFVDAGDVGGEPYVDVLLAAGLDPYEYGVPLSEAITRFGPRGVQQIENL